MTASPPLAGIRVLELAGLAPGPFAGLLLADYGASVLRIDRAHPTAHSSNPPSPTADLLTRHKSSIAVDLKSPAGIDLIKSLIPHVDVVIDPFRPGILEKLGLSPDDVLLRLNPRLIVGRLTGFRRDGKYRDMAGHDINYIAVSGVLSMLGRAGQPPYPPANIIGDFAGGGAMCVLGILLALFARTRSGRGQVVEANMVDGSAYLATMPRLSRNGPLWDQPRGENVLDGGCPYYDVYQTKDGEYMAVGALELPFFHALLAGLSLHPTSIPGPRDDRRTWPALRALFAQTFLFKTRREWETIFAGTDACVTPVLSQAELEKGDFEQRPAVTLRGTPAVGGRSGGEERDVADGGWTARLLAPGVGGEGVLERWVGWRRGRDYEVEGGGLVRVGRARL
ncbi:MAG: Isopenicillin N epimerase component 2 [Caeruleum heppii]|nr:MAG: Isopenicillin N epimerase component 2 [Caeruleum heppii]